MMSLLITSKQELCELWMNIAYEIIYLDVYACAFGLFTTKLQLLLRLSHQERKTEEKIYMYTNEPRKKFLRSVQ
jgi:hypothetical protein